MTFLKYQSLFSTTVLYDAGIYLINFIIFIIDKINLMAQLEKELIFVRNAIYTEPEDQSAWLYQRYIFEQLLSYHDT